KKLSEKKNITKETTIRIMLLNSRNLEEFPSEKRLEFAEEALVGSKKLDNQELQLEALTEVARCKQHLALFNESLEVIEKAEELLEIIEHKENNELTKKRILLLYYKGINLDRLAKLNLAFEVLTKAKKLAQKINEKKLLMDIYLWIAVLTMHAEEYEQGIDFAFKAKEIALEIDHKAMEVESLTVIGIAYQWTGKYSKSLEVFEEGIKIQKSINRNYHELIWRIGLTCYFIGELDKAIELFQEASNMRGNVLYLRTTQKIPWDDALVAWRKGELDDAIKFMKECVEVYESIGDKYHANLNSINLAAMYFDQGKIDLALDITLNALENLPLSSQNYSIGLAQQLLGKIYHVKGDFNLALDHAQKSLRVQTKMEVTHHLMDTLLLLTTISVDKGDISLANNYLEKLGKITKEDESRYFKQTLKVGEALILKASSRPKKWIKAIEILETVVKEDILNHTLTVFAMINLCELLINEFSISGDTEVLLELEKYTETLTNIAKKQNSFILKIEANNIRLLTLWLKAQFSIVEIDIQKAKRLLVQARDMADEEGLIKLAEKITRQQGELITRIDHWDEFIRKYYEFLKQD
ncbi:MAG: tetratricopeptide repeat protein, partial [Candidatus Heimdallarchaeota archaeon]